MEFLKKLLLGAWLKPLWGYLDGKKTASGIIVTLLAILGQSLGDTGNIPVIVDIIKENTGSDVMLTSGEVVLIIGFIHKIIKYFKK